MSYCLACSFGLIRIHTSLIDIDVVNKLSASQLVMLYQLYHPFLVQGGAPKALTHNRSTMCRCLKPIVWGSISGWNWGCLWDSLVLAGPNWCALRIEWGCVQTFEDFGSTTKDENQTPRVHGENLLSAIGNKYGYKPPMFSANAANVFSTLGRSNVCSNISTCPTFSPNPQIYSFPSPK